MKNKGKQKRPNWWKVPGVNKHVTYWKQAAACPELLFIGDLLNSHDFYLHVLGRGLMGQNGCHQWGADVGMTIRS